MTRYRPTICLNMIVRDEAPVIDRCLASVREHIDYWVIVDTGSLDDTPGRVEHALRTVPGELHHCAWRDFGYNRTDALQRARDKGDYLLFIDADEQLEVAPGASLHELDQDAYSLEARYGNLRYDRVALVSTALPWRWVGVLHEYLDAGQPVPQPRLSGFSIRVSPDGARSRDPRKFQKDAAVLEAALKQEPENARYQFYLAQSYRDAGETVLARKHYLRRARMSGWAEEAWYALYQVALLSEQLNAPHSEIVEAYLRAHSHRPQRAEALVALAAYFRRRQDWPLAFLFAEAGRSIPRPEDRLFVDTDVYLWRAADELALAAYYTRRHDLAAHLWRGLLAAGTTPDTERKRIKRNLAYLL